MKQNYFTLLFLFLATTTVFSQPAEFPKFFPFHTRQSPAVSNRSASNGLQRAKVLNQSAQTTYTHRIDSIVGTFDATSSSQSKNYMRFNYKYKGNNLRELTCYKWNTDSNAYKPSYGYIYSYDIQNRVDSFYKYSFNTQTGITYYDDVYINEYDEASRLVSKKRYYLNQFYNDWFLSAITQYQYAGSTLCLETMYSNVPGAVTEKVSHSFDAFKNDTLVKTYYFYYGKGQLSDIERSKYRYNSSNEMEDQIHSYYDVSSSDSTVLKLSGTEHTAFDSNGNVDSYSDLDYYSSTGELDSEVSLTTSDIDLNYKTAEISGYDKMEMPIYPKNLTKQWNVSLSGKAMTYKLYYSPLTRDGLTQTSTLETVKVLSGATQGIVSLQMPTEAAYRISVFNASGYQLQNIQTNGGMITLSKLPAGVYFYHCRSESQNYKGKFIVQ